MSENPTFELIIGPSGDYYYFKEEIKSRIRNRSGFDYDFIYFLPVKRAVRYFKEQLIDESSQQVLPDPPIFTFYEFMLNLYRLLPNARKVISSTMRLFLIEELLKRNSDELHYFSKVSSQRRGLVRKVDALVTELREYGYSAQELLEALEGETDRRIHDFSLLIEEFEAMLGDTLIDESGAIQQVLNHLENVWEKHYPHVKVIYLNGYGLFTRPMYRFFQQIRHQCSLKIKIDYLPEHPELFEHVEPAYTELGKLHPVVLQDREAAAWEFHLFRQSTPRDEAQSIPKEVLIQATQNREQEITFIANYVKRLHHHLNIPLHKIGITFPSLEQYAPLVHEIFPRSGLPYNISTGFPLSQSPLIRSFMLLLEVPLSGYDVKKLEQLLTSPFFDPAEALKVNPEGVNLIARELRLTSFVGKWAEELERTKAFLQTRRKIGIAEDEFEAREIGEKLALIENTAPGLMRFLDLLGNLEKRQSGTDFRNQYLTMLREMGFLDWYTGKNPYTSPREKEQEYRAFNRFIKVLDQFSWIITNLHGEKKLALTDFYQYLSLLVSQATYNLREWANYGVQLMPRLEIQAIEPQVLIFGGMVEGDFPRPFTHDVFFHDEEREEMGLIATEDLLAQDRYMFYLLLSSSAQRMVFTYQLFEKEAARVPSNFLQILSEQIRVRWREKLPEKRFMETSRNLLPRVARRIPEAIQSTDAARLRRWFLLNSGKGNGAPELYQWLERIRIYFEKQRPNSQGVYEGVISGFPEIVAHLQQRFQNKPFSITRLETYAQCPIKFYFRYILGVQEPEEIETGLTPLERGQLVHHTLFRFYNLLREKGLQREPWLQEPLLLEIAREEFDKLPFRGILFELEKEKYFGSSKSPGVWKRFLEREKEAIETHHFYPAYFELAFGRAGSTREQDPKSHATPVTLQRNGQEVLLTGKVDRVDTNEQGQALLLDYKTGRSFNKPDDINEGLALQLPLYAAVLPELIDRDGVQPVYTAFYQIRDEENCKRVPVMIDAQCGIPFGVRGKALLPNKTFLDDSGNPITFEGMLHRVEDFILDYVEGISGGRFQHSAYPDKSFCKSYCEFRRTCRKDVNKLRRLTEARGV